jgi:YVTN family beta-propeller protein
MKTKCPLPKGFSGTKGVSGILAALLALALLLTASGAGADPFAYISNMNAAGVTVIDGTTVLTPPTAPIGVGAQPFGVAVSPDGRRAYVANSNMFDTGVPSVSVIDTASLSVVATITVGIAGQPSGVAVSEDGSLVYVANNNGSVAVIDASTNTVVNTLNAPGNQQRQLAGIVAVGGTVWAVDLLTGEVINVIDPSVPGLFLNFTLMMGIAADPARGKLYAPYGDTNGDLQVAIIDVATSFAQQTFTSVLVSTPGNDAGFNPGGIAVSPSGTFVYAPISSENRLAVINTGNGNSILYRPMGTSPFGAAVDPLGTRVYVGNAGNRTVTVLDAATNTVLQSVSVGANPMVFGSFVAGERPAPPPPQFVLTVLTAGSGFGSITANPMPTNGTYAAGTPVTLTATPNSASVFTSWSGCTPSGNTCSVTMDAAKTVTATFTLKQYTLTVSMAGNGTGSVGLNPPGGTYNHGASVTLTATPATSSLFTSWSGCAPSGTTCSLTMDGPKTVTVTFTLKQYTLGVSMAGTGTGQVGLNPPGGTYNHGTSVSLTATPNSGSQFSGWSNTCGTTNPCVVVMSGPQSVTATFTAVAPPPPTEFLLTLATAGSGSGSIAANPASATGKYKAGSAVGVTATAKSGSKFTGWSGDCSGTGACNVTMNAAKKVTANFTVASQPPSTCDEKIKDWQKKVAERKQPWWQDHQLRISLTMYAEARSELGKAKAKVGERDKRYVRAENEFDNGKSALCHGHYWRADNEFWDAYQIAHQILKQFRR